MRRFFYSYQADEHFVKAHADLSSLNMGDEIRLPNSVYHHWCQVLRAKVGDIGLLFDGHGGEYQVRLSRIEKKSAHAMLQAYNNKDKNAHIHAKLALVMSRGDRMDYAIQKATELGVVAIQLLSSHHGEVHLKAQQVDKKLNHWQQIAISACEQCGLNRPPLLIAPMPIADYLSLPTDTSYSYVKVSDVVANLVNDAYYQPIFMGNGHADHIKLMLSVPNVGMDFAGANANDINMPKGLLTVLNQPNPMIELLVGGEGGFSMQEQQQALTMGWQAWQIGERVLRTETAPVVALASLQALHRHLMLSHQS